MDCGYYPDQHRGYSLFPTTGTRPGAGDRSPYPGLTARLLTPGAEARDWWTRLAPGRTPGGDPGHDSSADYPRYRTSYCASRESAQHSPRPQSQRCAAWASPRATAGVACSPRRAADNTPGTPP